MKKWEKIELGSNNLAEFDYENLGSDTAPSYRFKYITLENVDNGKLLQYIDCIFASAPSRARRIVHKNDLLISTVRPNLHSHYKVENNISNVICSTGFCVIRTNDAILDHNFLYHLFYSNIIDKQIELIISGSSYPAINSNDIKKIEIPLPPFPEQRRIAEALSDTDEFIAAMEKLIAKKRAINQGVMQELLTEKRRLPEFSGEWRTSILGDLCNVLNGYAFQSAAYVSNGKYRIITISNVQQGYLELSDCASIKQLPSNIQPYQMLKIGDILISLTGNVGRTCKITAHDLLLNQRVGLISNYKCDKDFLYYILQSTNFVNAMILSAKGGAQPNLSNKDIYEYEVKIPPTTAEQTAIASILSDMDTEIATLTTKLNKLRNIKQGMMSELLTGHIRLVEQEAR